MNGGARRIHRRQRRLPRYLCGSWRCQRSAQHWSSALAPRHPHLARHLQVAVQQGRGPFVVALLQRIEDRQVLAARDLDPFDIVHRMELGEPAQAVLLLHCLEDVGVARGRRQQLVELRVALEKALAVGHALQQVELLPAAALHLLGVEVEGRLQEAGRLQQHAETVALEARLAVAQGRQELPAVAVLALHHAFVGQPQQAAAQHALAGAVAAQQIAFGNLVGERLVQAVVDQLRVQRVFLAVQFADLGLHRQRLQRHAIALLGGRFNHLLAGEVRQRPANRRARHAKAFGQVDFLQVAAGRQVAVLDGSEDLGGNLGLQRGELSHGAKSFLGRREGRTSEKIGRPGVVAGARRQIQAQMYF